VGALALALGWRWAFFITGASGCVLLIVWWRVYHAPERDVSISGAERDYILSDRIAADAAKPATAAPYREILRDPLCVTLCSIRFLTDPFSYFISFWLIDYFRTVRGFSLETVALLGWLPFLASPFCGGPIGGAFSDWLIRRGVAPQSARVRLMAAAACLTPLALVAVHTDRAWVALAMSFVLIAANACWNVNKLTLSSELVSRHQVASMVSLGGLAGSIGGVVSTLVAGKLISSVGYVPVFTGLGFLHATAFAIFALVRWWIAPRVRESASGPK
jgi:ACS family hexuronate transporter-like MFS transporter